MILTIDHLKLVAGSGGGLILDASAYTFHQMVEVAKAAASGNASITFRNVSQMTAQQLRDLAATAPGLIVFDFTR